MSIRYEAWGLLALVLVFWAWLIGDAIMHGVPGGYGIAGLVLVMSLMVVCGLGSLVILIVGRRESRSVRLAALAGFVLGSLVPGVLAVLTMMRT
ncbi:MAG: hypothetical protein BIFFINMI_02624 [Phycisphaerae bacterium]|nr:hypothetical protein [Phycisphaerae bacterium]